MGSIVDELTRKQLITPPSFFKNNIQYEVIMGSVAYGVSSDTSDVDIYGFCVQPKYMIFPHLDGEIVGFGRKKKRFENWEKHHVEDKSSGKEYDFVIYSIIKYFQLCMENNPNMIDSLFVPRRCILHSTQIGEHIRERRKEFLHKGAFHRFKGYAYSTLHKLRTKKHKGLDTLIQFEKDHNIDNRTSFEDVINELNRRNIKIDDMQPM